MKKQLFTVLRLAQEACLWVLPISLVLGLGGSLKRPLALVLLVFPPAIRVILAIRDRFLVSYEAASEHFSREALIWLVSGVLGAFAGNSWAMPATLVCLVSDVFLMRILRQEKDGILTRLSLGLELLFALTLCAACLILSSPMIGRAVLSACLTVLRVVLTPVALLVGVVIYGLFYLFIRVLQLLGIGRAETEELIPDMAMGPLTEELQGIHSGNGRAALIFWCLVCAAIVFGAVWWLKKRIRSGKGEKVAHAQGEETICTRMETIWPLSDRFAITDRSARTRVRKAYRKFLKNLARSGNVPRPCETSWDVQRDRVTENMKEPAWKLRNLYVRARYDRTSELTEEQAAEAEALEKQLRVLFLNSHTLN